MVTKFVLNRVLHHVGLSWIFESTQQLEYGIEEHIPYQLTDFPWYNISICTKYMEQCLENILEMQELKDLILRVILMHMINNSHHMLIPV